MSITLNLGWWMIPAFLPSAVYLYFAVRWFGKEGDWILMPIALILFALSLLTRYL